MKLKNAGETANTVYDENGFGVVGYESYMGTLCAECAALSTVDGKPYLSVKGENEPYPIYARFSWPEVDSPIHCEDCGAMLPCSLTTDGQEYVRESYRSKKNKVTKLWRSEFPYAWSRS